MATTSVFPTDHTLDILVLGAMRGREASASAAIRDALEALLAEAPIRQLLADTAVTQTVVHIPESWDEQEIINDVLAHLDIADLVVVNITPVAGRRGAASPNVYYELGLVHALGLPTILVAQEKTKTPFYLLTTRIYLVPQMTPALLTKELREPLRKFLDPADPTDFTANRVSQFYEGLPIVDISAAVGLATGYYHNFVGRLLRDGLFVSTHPAQVRHLVVVRPANVLDTYEQDQQLLQRALAADGFAPLRTEQLHLDAHGHPPADGKGPIWIDHLAGVVLDLPRAIYPLKLAPRLLALQGRLDKHHAATDAARHRTARLRQTSNHLLDRVMAVLRYHVRHERDGYRGTLLHFATIEQVPALLRELGVTPDA